jgi:hypothetical protein
LGRLEEDVVPLPVDYGKGEPSYFTSQSFESSVASIHHHALGTEMGTDDSLDDLDGLVLGELGNEDGGVVVGSVGVEEEDVLLGLVDLGSDRELRPVGEIVVLAVGLVAAEVEPEEAVVGGGAVLEPVEDAELHRAVLPAVGALALGFGADDRVGLVGLPGDVRLGALLLLPLLGGPGGPGGGLVGFGRGDLGEVLVGVRGRGEPASPQLPVVAGPVRGAGRAEDPLRQLVRS